MVEYVASGEVAREVQTFPIGIPGRDGAGNEEGYAAAREQRRQTEKAFDAYSETPSFYLEKAGCYLKDPFSGGGLKGVRIRFRVD